MVKFQSQTKCFFFRWFAIDKTKWFQGVHVGCLSYDGLK